MFRKYGFIGVMLIILVQINFFLKIQPFASFYFPIIWFGYILIIDALVYKFRRNSMINNRLPYLLGMIVISSLIWWVFEFVNLRTANWNYQGLDDLGLTGFSSIPIRNLYGTIAFSTVLPALFETVELIRCIHLFDKNKLKKSYRITKRFLYLMIGLGIISFIAPIAFPKFAFPLVWLSFFLILDPINYLHKQPSVIGHLKDRKLLIPLSLLLSGIILGFLWEFWNYLSITKWVYSIPFIGFFKIFEMPVLGYLGYFPFSFELYAMYWFIRSLFVHKEHLLVD